MASSFSRTGILQCLFIITIPFGIQSFKLAGYALWPFGRVIVRRPGADAGLSCLGNAIWFVFSCLWLAIGHIITGVLLCITVIGIPLGLPRSRWPARRRQRAETSWRRCRRWDEPETHVSKSTQHLQSNQTFGSPRHDAPIGGRPTAVRWRAPARRST